MHDLCLQHAAHILSLHLLFLLPQCFPLLRHNPRELSHLLVLVGLPHSRTDAIAEEKVRCNVLGEGGAQLKHPSMCSEIEWARLGEYTKQSVARCTHRSWLPLVCLGPSCASWVSFSARSSLPKGLDSSRKRSCPLYPWMPFLPAYAFPMSFSAWSSLSQGPDSSRKHFCPVPFLSACVSPSHLLQRDAFACLRQLPVHSSTQLQTSIYEF